MTAKLNQRYTKTSSGENLPLLVSIIVNNFNYEAFLTEAIESALGQTYPHIEVLVVDDGSTDGSRKILKGFEDRVQVLYKENGGQSSALNLAFPLCSGNLVLFLDSDDVLSADAAQQAVEKWNPSWCKVQFPMRVIDEQGVDQQRLMPRAKLACGKLDQVMLTTGYYISPPASGNVWSHRVLAQLFPLPEREWPHDIDAYLHTLCPFFGDVGVIRSPLAFYRIHGKNMTNPFSGAQLNAARISKLLSNSFRQRSLLQTFAAEHKLNLSPNAVTRHWIHLKLELAYAKMTGRASNGLSLSQTAAYFLKSVWSNHDELAIGGRCLLTAWAFAIWLVPSHLSDRIVRFAFGYRPILRVLPWKRTATA